MGVAPARSLHKRKQRREREYMSSRADNVRTLAALGFTVDQCERALESCNGDVFEAAEYLLSYVRVCRASARA